MADHPAVPNECDPWVLKLLGDYVTLRIIDVLRDKELRFTEIERRIGDTNPVVLTDRLKRLEASGLIQRRKATIDARSVTYRLTHQGIDFIPVLRAIDKFARTGIEHSGGPADGKQSPSEKKQ